MFCSLVLRSSLSRPSRRGASHRKLLFSSSSSPVNTASDDKAKPLYDHKLVKIPLTGLGQVIFLNSSKSGGILLASLALADPYLATFATLGSISSTLTAQKILKDENTATGHLSYNGSLVGCATAVFVAPLTGATPGLISMTTTVAKAAAVTAVGAGAATALTAGLGAHYFTGQPQWTYAFNIVTLTMLMQQARTTSADIAVLAEATTMATLPPPSPGALDLIVGSPLHGLSQIFVVENMWTGLGVLAATAVYSPHLAGHALMGSVLGSATGYVCLGASPADVAAGLWGYNAALSSMAVAVFSVSNTASRLLSASAAVTSTVIFGALSQQLTVPCLTLPFCLTMSAIYPLLDIVPALSKAANPHSPEKNTSEADDS